MLITKVNFVFEGLYFDGRGWKDGDTILKWNVYWRGIHDNISWHFADVHDIAGDCQYLFGLHGSVYLHPQITNATLICEFGKTGTDYTYDELCRLMERCAKALGVSLRIENYRTMQVDF